MKTAGIAVGILGLAVLGLVGMGRGATAETTWEYRLEPKLGTPMEPPRRGEHAYQLFFEALGREGWEYVGSFGGQGAPGPQFALVFRRPKRP